MDAPPWRVACLGLGSGRLSSQPAHLPVFAGDSIAASDSRMYTLDTNAVLYYLGGDQHIREVIDRALERQLPLYVSAITVAELLRFPRLTAEEETNIKTFLSVCSIINVDSIVADRSAAIGRSYGLKLADSIIAATALFTGSVLLTRNIRDFRRVSELIVQRV